MGFGNKNFWVFLFFLLSSNSAQANYDPTTDLWSMFGSKCTSLAGSEVEKALDQSKGLQSIVQSLKDDDACRGISQALQSLEGFGGSRHYAGHLIEIQTERLRAQNHDLETAIELESSNPNSDPDLIQELKSELFRKRVELVTQKSARAEDFELMRRESFKNFEIYSRHLLSQIASSQTCITNHPNLIAQIGAQLVAMSSNFVSGTAGSVLYATGSIIDSFVQFLSDMNFVREFRALKQSRLAIGANCALESLAAQYCESRDIKLLIEKNASIRMDTKGIQNKRTKDSWMGVDLLANKLSAFLRWSVRLVAGSKASTAGQAQEKKIGRQLEADYYNLGTDLDADIARTERVLSRNNANIIDELHILVRNLSQTAQTRIFTNDSNRPGPLFSAFLEDPFCGPATYFYTSGQKRACPRDNEGENCRVCIERVHQITAPPGLDTLKTTAESLLAEASNYVFLESSLVNEDNHQLVLSQYVSRSTNQFSAQDFLNQASTYLEYLLEESVFSGTPTEKTIQLAKSRVDTVIHTVANPTEKASDDVVTISKAITPGGDFFFFAKEFREIVKQDLDLKIQNGDLDENLEAILNFSNSDSIGKQIQYYFGLDSLKSQALAAQRLTRDNMGVISRLFEENLLQAIQDIANQRFHGSHEDILDQDDELSLICIRSLLLPNSPYLGGMDLRNICENRVYYSVYRGHMIRYNDYSKPGTSFSQRACLLYDYYRKSRLIEMKSR
jgi:hypothetical protein